MKWSKLSPWGESKLVTGLIPSFTINSNKGAQHSLPKYDQTTAEVTDTKKSFNVRGMQYLVAAVAVSLDPGRVGHFPVGFRWATGFGRTMATA